MNKTLIGALVFTSVLAFADDELSGEIDKLSNGQIEGESVVPVDPSQSADDVENEIGKESGNITSPSEKPEQVEQAPDEVPAEVAGPQKEEQPPVVETQSPEEQIQEEMEPTNPEQKAEQFTPIEPPPTIIEDQPEKQKLPVVEGPVDDTPVQEEESTQETSQESPEQESPQVSPDEDSQPQYTESVPDDFEERMHRIYNQFYTEATSDAAWTQIAGEKINETYTIQPGDTLWDISVTFFGNGHYWPKVWEMNDDITNPHFISAGYVLKFVPGQINKAPQLNIAGQEASPNQTGEVAPGNLAASGDPVPIIPPPKKHVAVLKNLPASLPYIKTAGSHGYDKDGFDLLEKRPKIKEPQVYLTSYLSEEKPTAVGELIEMNEGEDETATLYETVFVQMTNGATIGEKLLIYNIGDKITDTNGDTMGYPVIQQGELEIQELVNPKKDVYRAIIIRSIGPAKVGSFVSRDQLAVGNLTAQGESRPVDAEIVGGTFDNEREYLGYQDLVYLNKGSNEGLKEGQVFTVIKSVKDRKPSSLVNDLKEQIAKIKVLKTTNARATAVVLQSSQYVRSGDFIGTQAKLPEPDVMKGSNSSDDESIDENSDIDSEFDQNSEPNELELE